MTISPYRGTVTMPKIEKPYPSVLDFLCLRFPKVPRDSWQCRIAEGKVLGENGYPIIGVGEYAPQKRIFYFREVAEEPEIPFAESILFQNDDLLVACKPHFLPVTPGGPYLDECLLHRLRKRTGNHDLVPIHRIDRETAGIVLFSANSRSRAPYCQLFEAGQVEKVYHALSDGSGTVAAQQPERGWLVENRMVPGEPWFRMKTAEGEVNARSRIQLVEERQGLSRFVLSPLTGKTHQLRLHMGSLGFPILNDRYYPELKPKQADDFNAPLQLVAKMVRFPDPVTGRVLEFQSERELLW
jgi:tRNA pseudouridine32 synthase / 23S rRNA pseudouridine746 synthase